jgi:transketolase
VTHTTYKVLNKMDARSKELRKLVIDMMSVGRRGHLGPALSTVEIIRVLYDSFLSYRAEDPEWEDRDRFIFSKGHGCLSLYAILSDKGFFPRHHLETFCHHDSILGGHPERGKIPGVEASTGALGHGPPIGVGMALAAKIRKKNHRVVVLTGDGEINEGSVWEAALAASKHKLSNFILMVDYNKLQSYGKTSEVLELEPLMDKWRSFGFAAFEVDGHHVGQLETILKELPLDGDRPSVVICHTVKGKGIPVAEGNSKWHHKAKITDEELAQLYSYFN